MSVLSGLKTLLETGRAARRLNRPAGGRLAPARLHFPPPALEAEVYQNTINLLRARARDHAALRRRGRRADRELCRRDAAGQRPLPAPERLRLPVRRNAWANDTIYRPRPGLAEERRLLLRLGPGPRHVHDLRRVESVRALERQRRCPRRILGGYAPHLHDVRRVAYAPARPRSFTSRAHPRFPAPRPPQLHELVQLQVCDSLALCGWPTTPPPQQCSPRVSTPPAATSPSKDPPCSNHAGHLHCHGTSIPYPPGASLPRSHRDRPPPSPPTGGDAQAPARDGCPASAGTDGNHSAAELRTRRTSPRSLIRERFARAGAGRAGPAHAAVPAASPQRRIRRARAGAATCRPRGRSGHGRSSRAAGSRRAGSDRSPACDSAPDGSSSTQRARASAPLATSRRASSGTSVLT